MENSRYIFLCVIMMNLYISQTKLHILDRTAFIIMSQPHQNRDQPATYLNEKIRHSLVDMGIEIPKISLLHRDLQVQGGWTIFPLLSPLLNKYSTSVDWFIFLDERSSVSPRILKNILDSYNCKEKVFIGKALRDQHVTKPHNFETNFNLTYPHFAAGFVLSKSLIIDLAKQMAHIWSIHINKFHVSKGIDYHHRRVFICYLIIYIYIFWRYIYYQYFSI